ncbi:LiaF domain-containing protein [uncultured Acetobacterium sp.]|uniref:LiaF transmembrane domain-containing protein n=1 Tax=uncultured Acetobacterium sp. TaxID=217139 RepID=UPI0025CBE273|nr:LiaF domain-containing protein [uncultured Acetobacterium sp.]
MRNRVGNLLWGLLLVVIGLGFAGNVFGLWNFELFFNGWWTLFIIIPCAISMVQNGVQLWNTIGLGIGVLLFVSAQGFFNGELLGDLIFPIIIVAIGLSIIFKDRLSKNAKQIEGMTKDNLPDYSAVFGGQEINFPSEAFYGATVSAIFGSVSLDLRQAIINEDIYISATAVFGGIDMLVPSNVRVEMSTTPIFGGASNKANRPLGENPPTIYLNSTNIFGGTEVK